MVPIFSNQIEFQRCCRRVIGIEIYSNSRRQRTTWAAILFALIQSGALFSLPNSAQSKEMTGPAAEKYHNIDNCFRQKNHLNESLTCVFTYKIKCYQRSDKSNVSEGICAQQTIDALSQFSEEQSRNIVRLSSEMAVQMRRSQILWNLNKEIICNWPELSFDSGSDIGRLKGKCSLELLTAQTFNNQQMLEYFQQNH
ncbi:hypothetical protein [Methylobacterium gossipiicola]|uniref:hypothetical protein n=1 Tax=Methylobacterium gossipiicola TaxID=582675 RepID=UPI0011608621|nr:hypothetical protein [Methylobacterium gossipiicola]